MNNYKTGTQGKTMYNDTMQTAYVGSHDTDLICVQSIQMVQNCHRFLQKNFQKRLFGTPFTCADWRKQRGGAVAATGKKGFVCALYNNGQSWKFV